ncbi:TPA: head maturation protease, ClpP-related, partial [Escherichia coli]
MPQRNDRSRSTSTTSPKNNSWFRMQAGHQSDADIYIYDEIGFWGVTAKQFISDLNALGDITHINLHINSPGGDVFEGIAIFNALKTHGASITVYVDGVAASMASVIAMVGNPVIMPENTFMMIHKPFGFTGGDAEDMRTYADLLDKVEAVLLPAYAQKTGKTTDEIAAMLADETWMAASINIKPGHDYYFYIRSVNTVGKSAFVEAVGRASDDAEGYLDFFKGKITESHLGKELLEKVELTEDNASRLEEF